MRMFVNQLRHKRLALSLLLATFLAVTLWTLMQSAWQSRPVVLAAGEGIRFVNEHNVALVKRDIRLLCFHGALDTSPDDIRFLTTITGNMPLPVPSGCTHVAALRLWHTQPSSKPGHGPAYWVYTTSWQPGSSDLTPLVPGGTTVLTIADTNTLVLFNVVIGLAWQPPETNEYIGDLLNGLGENSVVSNAESATSYLYDLTDGRMAFGPVTIHVNGEHWESTDIRIVPANDLKPSAQVGGIVPQSFIYTSTVFVTSTTVYSPGAITLGRNWVACAPATGGSPPPYLIACNPSDSVTDTVKLYGASDAVAFGSTTKYGNWDDVTGYRTIVHEWAHYALFLYDEYQNELAQRVNCTTPDNKRLANDPVNASAMDWHYSASELWYEMPPPGECAATKQYALHGLSDCETLAAWYTIQQLPDASTLPPLGCEGKASVGPDPLGVTKFLFNRQPPNITPTSLFPYSIFIPGLKFGPRVLLTPKAQVASTSQATIDALVPVYAKRVGDGSYWPPTFVQAYQLRPVSNSVPNSVSNGGYDRIWYQGKVISDTRNLDSWLGHVTVLGAQREVDQVKVFGESYQTELPPRRGGRWFGETTINASPVVMLQPDNWLASLDLAYEANHQGQVVTVTAHVTLPVIGAVLPEQIKAGIQLCSPDIDIRCYWDQPLTFRSTTAGQQYWIGSISPTAGQPTLPNYGIVRLHVSYDLGNAETEDHELMSWYKTSGVGPGSYNALAPTPPNEDDVVTLFSETVRRHCNQLVYSAATNAAILGSSLGTVGGNPFMGLLGQPVDIAVRLPLEVDGAACPTQFGQGSRQVAQKDIYLTLSYNHLHQVTSQETIRDDLPPAVEANLHILFFDPNMGWQVVAPATIRRDTTMNWLSVPFTRDGIYAIGWIKP